MVELTLLDEFLKFECSDYVRALLRDKMTGGGSGQLVLTLNRFDVVLDFDASVATILDDLDPSPAGSIQKSFEELLALLAALR